MSGLTLFSITRWVDVVARGRAGEVGREGFRLGTEIRFAFSGVDLDAVVVGAAGQEVVAAVGFFGNVAFDITRRINGLRIDLAQIRNVL